MLKQIVKPFLIKKDSPYGLWLLFLRQFQRPNPEIRLVVVLQLPNDWDLLSPTLDALKAQGHKFQVAVTNDLLRRSPELRDKLEKSGYRWVCYPRLVLQLGIVALWSKVEILLAAAESSAGPHRLIHHLFVQAKASGKKCYSMQHGFENIGLTYFDKDNRPEQIAFASDGIFLWGELSTLHPQCQNSDRCIAVGYPKSRKHELNPRSASNEIAVFENLHWNRYSPNYRQTFLEGLRLVIAQFPEIDFILKPHAESSVQSYERLDFKNFKIVGFDLNPIPAAELIAKSHAIITTPSTIALDAAFSKKPVAVVADQKNLPRYEPLRLLHSPNDWVEFVRFILRTTDTAREQDFVSRWVASGDAVSKITNKLFENYTSIGATQ